MFEHPISDLFKISMTSIKDMIDVNTIVGQRIEIGENAFAIPISKVKCGFATGGTDQSAPKSEKIDKYPFGGVTGGTVTINPIAFLVSINGEIKLLHTEEQTHLYEKLIDYIGPVLSQVKDLFTNKQNPQITKVEVIDNKQEDL